MCATEGYGPRRRRRAWAADNPGNAAARRELLGAIVDAAGQRLDGDGPVLDCGCGTGWLLEALADKGVEPGRLHGLDRDPARVDAARQRLPDAPIEVGDARHLPYPDGSFAVVLFIVTLSSLDGPSARTAIVEALRTLSPGGALIVYEQRVTNPLNRETVLVTPADLASAGAAPMRQQTLTLLPPLGRRLGHMTPVLHGRLSRLAPLRSHWLAVHRKAG